jgi:hypothetical protein
MGLYDHFSEDKKHYDTHTADSPHKSSITHEGLAGAASFAAVRAYENSRPKDKPVNHALLKESSAGVIGAFIDKEAETKGLNFIDKEKAKHDAKKRLHQAADSHAASGED